MGVPYAVSSDLVSAYPAKSLAIATYLDDALAAKSDTAPAINAQTGTTYTFVLADATAGKTITASNAAASTYTVPPQSSVAFSAGALLLVTNLGAGVVTFAGGVGVTVTNTVATLAQYQTATLVRTGSDAWTVIRQGAASVGLEPIAITTLSGSATTISSCFSALFTNYRVHIYNALHSTTAQPQIRMVTTGTPNTTANYDREWLGQSSSTVSGLSGSGASLWETAYGTSGNPHFCIIDLFNPFASVATIGMARHYVTGGGQTLVSLRFTQTTSFDGIQIISSAGTWSSGTVRIYGYN